MPETKQNDPSTPEQTRTGFIPSGSYTWFLAGVLLGGATVVPIATFVLMEGISPVVAWTGGIGSAVAFLLCFDKQGNWRWATAIPAIAVVAISANVYHQTTGRPVAAVGGILGFVIYTVLGFGGIGIGRLRGKK
jgi:hypothetical protein